MPAVLGYWDCRGIIEPIFMLLEYTETEYETKYYVTGPAPDYNKDCWLKEKNNLGLPFPNLPYMLDGDLKLCHTEAIIRHIARKGNLCGTTAEEQDRCDMVEQEVMDLRSGFIKLTYFTDNFEEATKQYINNMKTGNLKRYTDFLGSRNFFAGEKVTFCDFMMYEYLDQLRSFEPTILNDFGALKAFMARIEGLPRVGEYLKSDSFVNKPISNRMAKWGTKPLPRVQSN